MNIEVIREAEDRRKRQVWRFWVTLDYSRTIDVMLDVYLSETRPSVRHKYVVETNYGRTDRRNCTIQNVEDVPRPADVRDEAAVQAQRAVQVMVADGRGVRAPFTPEPAEIIARRLLIWEGVPYGRGNVEAFTDVPGIGRYLVKRTQPGSREFRVFLNAEPTKYRGTSDECKRAVQMAVDQHRITQLGL